MGLLNKPPQVDVRAEMLADAEAVHFRHGPGVCACPEQPCPEARVAQWLKRILDATDV